MIAEAPRFWHAVSASVYIANVYDASIYSVQLTDFNSNLRIHESATHSIRARTEDFMSLSLLYILTL